MMLLASVRISGSAESVSTLPFFPARWGAAVDRGNFCAPGGIVGGGSYRRDVFCRTCQGPVEAGFARCYPCELGGRDNGGLLADVVAAAGYAVRGGALADDLYRYKSDRVAVTAALESGARLRE